MNEIAQLNAALADRYLVEREIGVGGMATVYLARDLRHDRRVALKLLKPELGAVLGVERFLAEIRVTANLQHPNLLPLFDSGAADGLLFYVMPFVEGESLRHRLDREKQLPIDDALHIAAAVASALDYAHRQGVIHRDLKPENILLHEGEPLVADFGIALAVSNAGGGRITQTGLSLGTPQYMSPEQATGDRVIDGRTDIYSLAAVAYEMLTGEPPHTANTSQAIIARLLTEKPRSIRATRSAVPVHVEAAVERALEKLPADRFATAREFGDAVTGKVVLATSRTAAAVSPARPDRTRRERALAAALAATVVLWIGTGAGAFFATRSDDAPLVKFEVETLRGIGPLQINVSPDGRHVLYNAMNEAGLGGLWVRSLDNKTAVFLAGSDWVSSGAWSPDSREIAFSEGGRLVRLSRTGGPAQTIATLSGSVRGINWADNGMIFLAMDGVLHQVPASGGTPRPIDVATPEGVRWEHPVILPDGESLLLLTRTGADSARGVYVTSIDGGAARRIMPTATRVSFAEPDLLLFVRDDVLYAQRVDLGGARLVGDAIALAEDVGTNPSNGAAAFAVSRHGTLIYRPRGSTGLKRLTWFSRTGVAIDSLVEPAQIFQLSLSPDGRRIAATFPAERTDTDNDLWVTDLATKITTRLTRDTSGVGGIAWSPDSRSVAYRSLRPDGGVLRVTLGEPGEKLIVDGVNRASAISLESYSPDGQTLLVRMSDSLMVLPMDGTGTPRLLTSSRGIHEIQFSPDGKRVAYNSNSGGSWQIYVASYPSFTDRRQVSADGGMQPRWRGDGRELFFLGLGGELMSASLAPGSTTEFQAPRKLFASPLLAPNPTNHSWDVTADGQRFLFPVSLNLVEGTLPPITVVLNWQQLLQPERRRD